MAPKVVGSPSKEKKLVHTLDHAALREALSPISHGKTHQLEAPSKKGLTEYDRTMSNVQGSVVKAIKSCTSLVDKVKEEEERERARQERLAAAREKEQKRRDKALQKARQQGSEAASQALVTAQAPQQESSEGEEEGDDNAETAWALTLNASELLQSPKQNVGRDLLRNFTC